MLFNEVRAREFMERHDLNVLIASSPTNVTYFTDYFAWLDGQFREYMMIPGAGDGLMQAFAVFLLEGPPALIVNPEFAVNAVDLWVQDIHIYGTARFDEALMRPSPTDHERRIRSVLEASEVHETAADALAHVLRERGLDNGHIGLERTPSEYAEAIAGALPKATLKDATNLIRLIRMVKSPDELSALTRAAEIAEDAAVRALGGVRPGASIQEAVETFRCDVAKGGAEFDHFAFGIGGLGIATEPNHILRDDDMLYIDYGCVYRRCFSDSGTTLTMQPLTAALRERHAALRDCLRAGQEVMRPGAKSSDVSAAMWEVLGERGVTRSFPHGHGVGLELRDYPIIVADNGRRIQDDCVDVASDLPLEENMVLNLESNLNIPGTGSLHVEMTFVVTANGAREIVPQDRGAAFLPNVAR